MWYQREQNQLLDIFQHWDREQWLWIHLQGDETVELGEFLNGFFDHYLDPYPLYFRHDFARLPFYSDFYIRRFILFFIRQHREQFDRYLSRQPRRFQKLIQFAIEQPVTSPEQEAWLENILNQFLKFLASQGPIVLALEGLWDANEPHHRRLWDLLFQLRDLPLVLMTTGLEPLPERFREHATLHLRFSKLSIQETEKLISEYLQTDALNARLISNHLYLKSGGASLLIKYLLKGLYQEVLEQGQEALLRYLNRPSRFSLTAPEHLFPALRKRIGDAGWAFLSLLSRLPNPLPVASLTSLYKSGGFNQTDYQCWLQAGLLRETTGFDQSYVSLSWSALAVYLRNHVSLDKLAPLIHSLGKASAVEEADWPVEISTLYFDSGEVEPALRYAWQEGLRWEKQGRWKRAMERYSFLRRNAHRAEKSEPSAKQLLEALARMQKRVGLYENAFESLRELRDQLSRNEREEWLMTGLQMADALLRMDALSEARYLLQDIRIKKRLSPKVQFYLKLLLGELEQNFGHAEYALRRYREARQLLGKVSDAALLMRLYRILKRFYQEAGRQEELLTLIEELVGCFPEGCETRHRLQVEQISLYIRAGQFRKALPIAQQLYSATIWRMTPSRAAHLHLYLSEIYAYLGKWYLSRAYVQKLSAQPLLLNNSLRAEVLFNLGMVEKELGRFGKALGDLNEAAELTLDSMQERQYYQIRLQQGHIYLLVNSYLRAREQLIRVYEWAEAQQDEELFLQSALFLSAYELQQDRPESAAAYLEKARQFLHPDSPVIDQLNYGFYYLQYLMNTGALEQAWEVCLGWSRLSEGIAKFRLLAHFLRGKLEVLRGETAVGASNLQQALDMARRCRLIYQEFLILRDFERLGITEGFPDAQALRQAVQQAFRNFLEQVGDPILQRQLEESREYEEIGR